MVAQSRFIQLCTFAVNLSPYGVAMLVCSLPSMSWKRLAHSILYTSAKHADLVHDVIDTDCQTQNGSTRSCIFMTFRYQFLTNHKLTEKWLSLISSLPIDRAHDAAWLGVSFKYQYVADTHPVSINMLMLGFRWWIHQSTYPFTVHCW